MLTFNRLMLQVGRGRLAEAVIIGGPGLWSSRVSRRSVPTHLGQRLKAQLVCCPSIALHCAIPAGSPPARTMYLTFWRPNVLPVETTTSRDLLPPRFCICKSSTTQAKRVRKHVFSGRGINIFDSNIYATYAVAVFRCLVAAIPCAHHGGATPGVTVDAAGARARTSGTSFYVLLGSAVGSRTPSKASCRGPPISRY